MLANAARRRRHARTIFQAGLEAADPRHCIARAVRLSNGSLHLGDARLDMSTLGHVVVIGAGKATPAMASALEDILGDRINAGAINTKYGHTLPLSHIETSECGHPIPDAAGVAGTEKMLSLLNTELSANDLVIALFSGGGSALMPAPAPGLSLAEKQQTTQLLLTCGATIEQTNAFRKHMSMVKGGQLSRLAEPAQIVTLALSDVVGDSLSTIASGPTTPDPTSFADCKRFAHQLDIETKLPSAVHQHLLAGASGQLPETPREGDSCFAHCNTYIIGNNSLAIEAASQQARRLGYTPMVLSSRIVGETREVAGVHTAIAQEIVTEGLPVQPPACIISGGETTVTVRGRGKGGRNQEFALAAAINLPGWEQISVLSGGTDGTDGPTDAAGAVADGHTIERAQHLGLDPSAMLTDNDSYHFFQALDDLIITGPTGTNVMDLRLLLVS